MDSRRVWPTSSFSDATVVSPRVTPIKSSIDFPIPDNRRRVSTSNLLLHLNAIYSRLLFKKLPSTPGTKPVKSRNRSKSNHFKWLASGGFSEICCVCGVIITTIGVLTAISGIFPKNQAQIRLFLECFGCAMILVGILIVFLSLRMQTSNGFRKLNWLQLAEAGTSGGGGGGGGGATGSRNIDHLFAIQHQQQHRAQRRSKTSGTIVGPSGANGGAHCSPGKEVEADDCGAIATTSASTSASSSSSPLQLAANTHGLLINWQVEAARVVVPVVAAPPPPLHPHRKSSIVVVVESPEEEEEAAEHQQSAGCSTLQPKTVAFWADSNQLPIDPVESDNNFLKIINNPQPRGDHSRPTTIGGGRVVATISSEDEYEYDDDDEEDEEEEEEIVVDESEEEEEDDGAFGKVVDAYFGNQLGSCWLPGATILDDSCASSTSELIICHQATIETVLSIVLTAATLVGFRPDQNDCSLKCSHCCCLHHAVQHKLSARKWIRRLRNPKSGTPTATGVETSSLTSNQPPPPQPAD